MTNNDPLDIVSQEQTQEKAQADQEKLARQTAEDLKWIMSDKRGRRFMWGLLSRAGVYRSSFTGNSETFFREGMRNLGLMYVNDLHASCPDRYYAMVKEAKTND